MRKDVKKDYPAVKVIQEGEVFDGYLVDISAGKSKFGDCEYGVFMMTDTSEKVSVCLSAALRYKILKENMNMRHWLTNNGYQRNQATGMSFVDYQVEIDDEDTVLNCLL